jgi:cell division septation protein DedD
MRISMVAALSAALAAGMAGCSRQQSDWQKARGVNSIDSFEQFLKKYPDSEFTAQAQARVKELYEERDWQKARDADTPAAYQEFLKAYSEGKWAEEARIRIENFSLAQPPSNAPSSREAPATEPATATPPAAAGAAASKPAIVPEPAAKPVVAKAAAKPVPHKTAAASSASKGAYRVQLGAFAAGAATAQKHWSDLDKKFPSLLQGLNHDVLPLKTEKGEIYRLQAVGLSETRARSICAELKAQSQACAVVTPN